MNITIISASDLTYRQWLQRNGISNCFSYCTRKLYLTFSHSDDYFVENISTSVWEICDTESCHLEHLDLEANLQLKMNMLLQVSFHPTAWKTELEPKIRLYEISQSPGLWDLGFSWQWLWWLESSRTGCWILW